ncbi:MAG: hypothetical protein ACK4MV_08915 [Beijerinckiaceae bacterium]
MAETALDTSRADMRDGQPHRRQDLKRTIAVETVRALALTIFIGVAIAMFLPKRTSVPIALPALPAGWSAVEWPYLRDQFDPGVALRCAGADCAFPFEITIRPKRGFCDCDRGIYDDTHLREVGDIDLARTVYAPRAPGEVVRVGELDGRLQLHAAQNGESAVSAALHKGCDMIAIVARGRGGPALASAMLDFLRKPDTATWLAGLLQAEPPA